MSLKLRRGLSTDRTTVTPAEGELLYTTDTKLVYVGDGSTAGGNIISSGGGGTGNIVDDTSPQLGGNLDVNGFDIVSADGVDINIDPGVGGKVLLNGVIGVDGLGNFTHEGQLNFSPTGVLSIGNNTNLIDGNVYITRNSYASGTQDGFTFAQHHDTPDAVNFQFLRTRGQGSAPAALLNGDDIIDIWFLGRNATAQTLSAAMSVTVDGVPTSTNVPGKFSFATNNGTATAIRAELSAAGVWKVNSLQNYSGTDLTLTSTNIKMVGNVQLNAQSDLRFADSDSSNWVAFQAPSTVSSNVTWTLPATDGTNGQVLVTNGAGTLSWGSGTSGFSSRSTLPAVTTSSLGAGASEDATVSGYKGYILYKIETSSAAWVRLYTSVAARTADASRLEGTDPLPGAGVVAEIITTGAETILISPGAIGFSSETIPTSSIPCTITNKSGVTTTITVTVTALQLEV